MVTVAVLVGSLRRESHSRKVAGALAELAPSLSFDFVDIGRVSFFSEDLEDSPPRQWVELREHVAAANGVLFVSPEYIRSVPGVLKNAIDICARPYGASVLQGKPAAIISTAIGSLGGFGANHHLRQSLASLDMPTMGQPEAYIGNMAGLFDAEGRLVDESTRVFLTFFGRAFEKFIVDRMASARGEIAA